jgi:translation initiation factor IF-2
MDEETGPPFRERLRFPMTKEKPIHRKASIKTLSSPSVDAPPRNSIHQQKKKLEIVLKCDSVGSREAVIESLAKIKHPYVDVKIIFAEFGPVSKTDLLMAITGSRLVLGFNVKVSPGIEKQSKEENIEIRLYDVIYELINDVRMIADSLVGGEDEERIIGNAKIIALFKAGEKGTILGCDVLDGFLARGRKFRVISAMGTIYSGEIESLYIENDAVNEAKPGQRVGLRIPHFKRAKLGDLVESYEIVGAGGKSPWQPRGGIFRS